MKRAPAPGTLSVGPKLGEEPNRNQSFGTGLPLLLPAPVIARPIATALKVSQKPLSHVPNVYLDLYGNRKDPVQSFRRICLTFTCFQLKCQSSCGKVAEQKKHDRARTGSVPEVKNTPALFQILKKQ